MSYVFISYNRDDTIHARTLIKVLDDASIPHWIDTKNITPGNEWRQEIDDAIRDAFALVVVWSPNAIRDYITYEWSFALGAQRPVIPLVFKYQRMSPRLTSIQHIKVQDAGWENHLLKRLNVLHEAFQNPANIPMDKRLVANAEVSLYIERLQHHEDSERIKAAYALSQLRDPRAIPALVSAMSFEDTETNMIQAIGKIGHIAGAEALMRVVVQNSRGSSFGGYSNTTVRTAVKALALLGEPVLPLIVQNLNINGAYDTFGDVLEKFGERAVPELLKALNAKSSSARATAASIIGNIFKNNKTPPQAIITQLAAKLSDPNDDVVTCVEEALEEIGSDEALALIANHKNSK